MLWRMYVQGSSHPPSRGAEHQFPARACLPVPCGPFPTYLRVAELLWLLLGRTRARTVALAFAHSMALATVQGVIIPRACSVNLRTLSALLE